MPREALAHIVSTGHPGDVAGLAALLDAGVLRASEIVAVLGKTEGNGGVNDFTRAYAVEALSAMLAPRLGCAPREVPGRVAMVMSGGTEGGLSPHLLVLGQRAAAPGAPEETSRRRALAIGVAATNRLPPEAIGRKAQMDAVHEAVRAAMALADIADPADVHYVQVKCPLLTAARVAEAEARGATVATRDTLKSMGLSRGASALGVARALREVADAAVNDAAVGADWHSFSRVASCSAGVELERCELVVLGMAESWAGPLAIAHDVMRDAIDLDAVRRALAASGGELVALLCKAEPSSTGLIRGRRHTMLDDSDIAGTRHARALVGGVVAAATGRTDLFVSGGAEHQGPDGGGPVAVVARRP